MMRRRSAGRSESRRISHGHHEHENLKRQHPGRVVEPPLVTGKNGVKTARGSSAAMTK